MIIISPVHRRADCCLEMSYKHSSYCCVTYQSEEESVFAVTCLPTQSLAMAVHVRILFLLQNDEKISMQIKQIRCSTIQCGMKDMLTSMHNKILIPRIKTEFSIKFPKSYFPPEQISSPTNPSLLIMYSKTVSL